jgi:hypothetical protein
MPRRRFLLLSSLIPLCLLALSLAGCATDMTATATKTLCAAWRPITYSGTRDTSNTVRQVRVHNKTGQNLGCWR